MGIPAAEHGTVFAHPGTNELSTLRQFGQNYDGVLAAPPGGVLRPRRGQKVKFRIRIKLPLLPNWAQFVPKLASVDVIRGAISGHVVNADTSTTSTTAVVWTSAVSATSGSAMFEFIVNCVEQPFKLHVCGSDGKRTAAGLIAGANNVSGPVMDILGSADPWRNPW